MNKFTRVVIIFAIILVLSPLALMLSSSTTPWATNEDSYRYGYWRGSLTGPQNGPGANWNPNTEFDNGTCRPSPSFTLSNGIVMPAVTNTTACQNGWFSGYKDWCINHAVDCVQNITIGDFPPMILQAHEQLLAGAKAANGSGNSMCPIGSNQAFCTGWDSNNGVDYGNRDCGDNYANYTGPSSRMPSRLFKTKSNGSTSCVSWDLELCKRNIFWNNKIQ
jgi:hypothetical protein